MANPFKVQIDEDIEAIIPKFFENLEKDIISVENAIKAKNSDEVAKLGHKGKGSSGSYGFTHLQELFKGIEEAGKASDLTAADEHRKNIRTYIAKVEIEYITID